MLNLMMVFIVTLAQLAEYNAFVPSSARTCNMSQQHLKHHRPSVHVGYQKYSTLYQKLTTIQKAEANDDENEGEEFLMNDVAGEIDERFPKGASAAVEDRDDHLRIIDNSLRKHSGQGIYERIFGEDVERLPRNVHTNTRWVVVSHDKGDTTPASVLGKEGPVFNYGNFATLAQFRMTWDDFTCLPSKYSAEMGSDREARVKLLQEVTDNGYVDETSGIVRVASDGTRFFVPRYIVWNTYDDDGNYYGQACIFDRDACRPAD